MRWDSPLYAINMFYYHWLIKKLLWPMTERIYVGRKTKFKAGRRKVVSRCYGLSYQRRKTPNITGKPQRHGETQINRNVLI